MRANSIRQWEVLSSTGSHFDVLDGIRGVAILMVVAFHAFYTNPESGAIVQAIGGLIGTGWIGVPIFFVLSGFLISYPFFRERAANHLFWYQPGYVKRRVGKIVPPYYLSIAIFLVYYVARFWGRAYVYTALQWAVGLPNFFPAPRYFNGSYWSLVVEVHFYVILPGLFLLTKGLKPRHCAAVMFFILFLVPLIARQLTWPQPETPKGDILFMMARFPCQLDFFAWGVLFSGVFVSLSSIRQEIQALSLFGYAGLVLLAASLGFWRYWSLSFDIQDHPARWSTEVFHLLPSAATFLMLFFVFDPKCFGARILSHPWLRFIGIVSYEWFLFHQPVVSLFHEIFGKQRGSVGFYFLTVIAPLALTFCFSVFVYRYFSLPIMNWVRGKRRGNAS